MGECRGRRVAAQRILRLRNAIEHVIAADDVLAHAVLKAEDVRPRVGEVPLTGGDGGDGVFDPLEHRRGCVGRDCLLSGNRPGGVDSLELLPRAFELHALLRQDAVPGD